MNIPALPSSIISSLAGTDRAASHHTVAAANADNTPHRVVDGESIDSLDESRETGDSEADGRQMLDTFERRQQPEHEAEPPTSDIVATEKSSVSTGRRLDLQA